MARFCPAPRKAAVVAVEGSADLDIQTRTDARKVDVGELVAARHRVGGRLLGTFGFVGVAKPVTVDIHRRPGHALPPALAVTDASILARKVDGAVHDRDGAGGVDDHIIEVGLQVVQPAPDFRLQDGTRRRERAADPGRGQEGDHQSDSEAGFGFGCLEAAGHLQTEQPVVDDEGLDLRQLPFVFCGRQVRSFF